MNSLLTILTKHVSGLGKMSSKYFPLAKLGYHILIVPNLANLSPYE